MVAGCKDIQERPRQCSHKHVFTLPPSHWPHTYNSPNDRIATQGQLYSRNSKLKIAWGHTRGWKSALRKEDIMLLKSLGGSL